MKPSPADLCVQPTSRAGEAFMRVATELSCSIVEFACPDQYVGKVSGVAETRLSVRHASNARTSANERCMILILESPHKDEFKGEPGPARGATGHAISSQLMNVIGLRQFSDYGLILMNAIQYQCSLGKPTAKHRDTVFRRVWGSGGAEDFKDRLKTTYRPGDVIVNCCIKGTSSVTNQQLRTLVKEAIDECGFAPPSIGRNHPASWTRNAANRERVVYGAA